MIKCIYCKHSIQTAFKQTVILASGKEESWMKDNDIICELSSRIVCQFVEKCNRFEKAKVR